MKLLLKNLETRNTLTLLANKFLTASIDCAIKNKHSKQFEYENQALALGDCLNHLETLIIAIESESVRNIDLTRVVAIQNFEIRDLKAKVDRLEKEIQFRDL